jgi:hypothetical protein
MPMLKKNIQVMVFAVALAAVTAVAATAQEGGDPVPPGDGTPQVAAIEEAAREAASVLATTRTSGDALPVDVAEHFDENADFGMNPDLSRRAIGGTSSVFVIPANGYVCATLTVGPGADVSCQRTDKLAAGEVGASTVTLDNGGLAIYGIVPDGVDVVAVDAGTDSTEIDVVDNAYLAVLPGGADLETVSYTGPAGPVEFPIYDPAAVFAES